MKKSRQHYGSNFFILTCELFRHVQIQVRNDMQCPKIHTHQHEIKYQHTYTKLAHQISFLGSKIACPTESTNQFVLLTRT